VKRTLLFIALIAGLAAAVPAGWRLPWNLAEVIGTEITNDSLLADTSFFKHNRTSDSSYTLYWSFGTSDSASLSVLKGRVAKVTVRDTLLVQKPYFKVVHAESLFMTKGYIDKSDTAFFTHNDQTDSTAALYASDIHIDSSYSRVYHGLTGNLMTLADTVLTRAPIYVGGAVEAESALKSKHYIDQSDTASFKHNQRTDSTTALYARSVYADSLFINNVAMDTWGLKAGKYITLTWTADTGTVEVDTADIHTWLGGIYPAMINDTADILRAEFRDTATVVWKDSAPVMRGDAGDSARAAAKDTAVVLRDAAGDSARAAAKDTAAVVRDAAGDSARAAAKDTAVVLRGEFRDTATVVWKDSAPVMRGDAGDSARAAAKDTSTALRDNLSDTARIAAHDTAVAVRGEIVDSIGSFINDTANILRAEIRDTAEAIDSLHPTVIKPTRVRAGSYFFSGGGLVEVDSSSIAADSSIFYLWINTKRYALMLSNP